MSLDLGIAGWAIVGVVDGHALLAHARERRSRWVDLSAWPGKLLPVRDEIPRAVCRGAMLVGDTVYTYAAIGKRRTAHALPAGDHLAIGIATGRVVVVRRDASPLVLDGGAWRPLAGESGADAHRAAVVPLDDGGALVVWGGRVLRLDGDRLVATAAGDLPPGAAACVATGDGFVTTGGGKLVVVARAGMQRDDIAVGELALASVVRYDGRLLLGDGRRYYLYAGGAHARLDLGTQLPDPDTLIPAPCGLVALVDRGRVLMRVRP